MDFVDEYDFAAVVWADEAAFHLEFLSLPALLLILIVLLLLTLALFSRHVERPQEAIVICDEYFGKLMVVECMDYLLGALVVSIQLERLQGGILIQKFRIVLDEPLYPASAIEHQDMFLGENE